MSRAWRLLCLVLPLTAAFGLVSGGEPAPEPPKPRDDWAATFSIIAHDPDRKEWGVAVASKSLAVGAVVPWAKAGVGAIATQSAANVTYGTRGLEMLAEGKSAEEVVKALTEADEGRASRQLGIIDAKGRTANFTGAKCSPWAGAKSGTNCSCQGNLLAGEVVVN